MKIKCFGCGESGEYYPYVPSKVYCFSCYNKVVQEREQLKTENEKLRITLEIIAETATQQNLREFAQQALNEVKK